MLNWILELLEKLRFQLCDDGVLKLFLPLTQQYMEEFVQSELLSRRLAHYCSKKLSFMLSNVSETNVLTSPQGDVNRHELKETEKEKKDTNPIQNTLMEYQNCHHHRDIS